MADFGVLSSDYFAVPEHEIKELESLLTVVDGKVVYAAAEFSAHGPSAIPVSPDWSPVAKYPGHYRSPARSIAARQTMLPRQ